MATSQFGKLNEFVPDQKDWTQYIEQLEQFFFANDITSAENYRQWD